MSLNSTIDGLKLVYSHNGLIQSNEPKQTAGTHNSMKDSQAQTEAEAIDPTAHILHDFNYMKFENRKEPLQLEVRTVITPGRGQWGRY